MKDKVQIIERNGKPEYAVVPWADYQTLTSDNISDEALFDAAIAANQGYDPVPLETAERIFDGENPVKVFREWRGLKQNQLAKIVKISQPYLSEIEKGKPASFKTMVRIAGRLGVPLDALVTAED